MNISSIIIYTNKISNQQILQEIKKIQEVEIVTVADDKIVALINSKNNDDEITIFRKLETIKDVISVAMVYAYQEEIQQDIQNIKEAEPVSKMLNEENIKAEQIVYNGHIGDKI